MQSAEINPAAGCRYDWSKGGNRDQKYPAYE